MIQLTIRPCIAFLLARTIVYVAAEKTARDFLKLSIVLPILLNNLIRRPLNANRRMS